MRRIPNKGVEGIAFRCAPREPSRSTLSVTLMGSQRISANNRLQGTVRCAVGSTHTLNDRRGGRQSVPPMGAR